MPQSLLTLLIILTTLLSTCAQSLTPPKPGTSQAQLTSDGAWCWFSDPRAIYYYGDDAPQIISGWVKQDGTIEAGSLDLNNGDTKVATLWQQLEKDDHDNPSFVETADGNVLAHYAKHGSGKYYQNSTNTTGDISTFSEPVTMDVINPELLEEFPRNTITYANPYSLSAENGRIYSFGRWTGYKPNMMWSDDDGATWSDAKVVISTTPFDPGNRPYVKYHSDGGSKIHLVFTDGHPRNEPTNSVYYAYYEDGSFHRADGSVISTVEDLPFQVEEASVVYQATEDLGKAWIFDIAATESGDPVIAYTRYPNDEDHRYHYAIYKNENWIDHEICASGKWFPHTPVGETEREPNYSAGLTIHPGKINTIYLSRDINGVFEIEKRVTNDDGASWDIQPITRNSEYDNVRPYFPRNYRKGSTDVVLWMENVEYIHYTNYDANIRYFVDE